MKKGTLESTFKVTDFKNDLTIVFKGKLPSAFREGDMAVISGFIADHKSPDTFVATFIDATHEIKEDRWKGERAIDRHKSINLVERAEEFEYAEMK